MAGDPGGTRIGSPLIGGYTYVYRSYLDFVPWDNTKRTYTDSGVWGTTQPYLRAPVDLPYGAVLRDIEFYVTASSQIGLTADLWRTQGGVPIAIDLVWFPGSPSGMRVLKLQVDQDRQGPFAPGSRLVLGVQNSGPTAQLNGARVGFTRAPAGVVMLDKPFRAYDSRKGAKIGNGQTRIHSLGSLIPAGATAAVLNLTVLSGDKTGGLAVYAASTTVPTGSAVYWSSSTKSIRLQTRVTSDKRIKVTMRGVTGSKCHYFYDVIGYAV